MKIIKPSFELMDPLDYYNTLIKVERCGRFCYRSEDQSTGEPSEPFIRSLIKKGHESVIEHVSFSVKFVVDRGVSHEIVRHRLSSYSQESTRYCNYSRGRFNNEITVIRPCFLEKGSLPWYEWLLAMEHAETAYFKLLEQGCTAQEARSVLPNSLKTELAMTANLREWRHFLKLRTSSAAHPQMREITIPLLEKLKTELPVFFEDIIL